MILAVDTATRTISVALAEADRLVAEETWQSENNHTMELAPAVERLLVQAGVGSKELTAIAVAVGPGSFTGVRIGLGFAKGLALAVDLPVIGVRTLDITMRALPISAERAIAVAQAGRGRVIWAEYRTNDGRWQATSDGVVGTWETVARLAHETQSVVIGELDEAGGGLLNARGTGVARPEQNVRKASRLAEIGWERWRAGAALAAELVQPVYAQQPTSGTA